MRFLGAFLLAALPGGLVVLGLILLARWLWPSEDVLTDATMRDVLREHGKREHAREMDEALIRRKPAISDGPRNDSLWRVPRKQGA